MDPERDLCVAVLTLAIDDLASNDAVKRRDALTWLTSTSRYVGSFNWICHQVDVDPADLRGGLDLKAPPAPARPLRPIKPIVPTASI